MEPRTPPSSGPASRRRESADANRNAANDDAEVSIVSSFEQDDADYLQSTKQSRSLSPSKLKRSSSGRGVTPANPLRKHNASSSKGSSRTKHNGRTSLLRQSSSPAWFAPIFPSTVNGESAPSRENTDRVHDPRSKVHGPDLVAPQALRPIDQTMHNVIRGASIEDPAVANKKGTEATGSGLKAAFVHSPILSSSATMSAAGPIDRSPGPSPSLLPRPRLVGTQSERRDSAAIAVARAAPATSPGQRTPPLWTDYRRGSSGQIAGPANPERDVREPTLAGAEQGPITVRPTALPTKIDASARAQSPVTATLALPHSPSKVQAKPVAKSPILGGALAPSLPEHNGKTLPNAQSERPNRPKAAPPVETVSFAPFSLWEYLKEEVLATDFDSTQEMKWERVTNFVAVPWWVEKIILFGFFVCLDSFLYTFTILPLRFVVAIALWLRNTLSNVLTGHDPSARRYLHSSHKCDILKTLLFVLSCFILSRLTDASKMYHSVRGQDVVKLYVIFNVMEIADRLCCSLGQDLLDALFSRMTLARRKDGSQPVARPLAFFLMALLYIQAHTMVLFYQLVTLNVAINSYDNALLTLLLSNQFVEIKGSVFKKFEKENLFQLTCADIVERFQLALILTAIGIRNLIEVGGGFGSGPSSWEVPLPRSFTVLPSISVLATSFAPVAIVLLSECVVDWLKHAFITKFNHIRPTVYGRFMDVLCRDLVVAGPATSQGDGGRSKRRHTFVDQSPVVSRRLGFAALPLACLLVRISAQIWGMLADDSHFDECAVPAAHSPGGLGSGGLEHLVRILLGDAGAREAQSWIAGAIDSTLQVMAWGLTAFVGWAFLVAVKLLLGASLVSFASYRYRSMAAREAEEELNARDRPPVGVDRHEREYEAKTKQLLSQEDGVKGLEGGAPASAGATGGKKPAGTNLMDVGRYTMVKSRLW
ncbi:unnamed protein product [Parajaminaea phylloscopi]